MRTLIIGDSFVEGVGSDANGGWAQQYAKTTNGVTTISGQGGDNTIDLLERVAKYRRQSYELVVIEIGLNDSRFRPSKGGQEVALDDFRANMGKVVRQFLSDGSEVAIMGLTRVDESKTEPYKPDKYYRNNLVDQYDDALREIAHKYGALYVPVPALADEPGSLSDGLHPSAIGHKKLLSAFLASGQS